MSLEEKDKQIEELEKIIDYIGNNSHDISFCDREYGDLSCCKENIKTNKDVGCIACKMIHEYKDKYKQIKN